MRFVRIWPHDRGTFSNRIRAHFSPWQATIECDGIFGALVYKARQNGMFAISEICKGLVIIGVGDIVTAEGLGELLRITEQTVRSLIGLDLES
jgi:hypothetical protein